MDDARPAYVNFFSSDWLGGCATLPAMVEWVYLQVALYNMDKGEAVPANRLPLILVRHGGDWQADLDLLLDLGKVHRTASGGIFIKRSLAEFKRAHDALMKKKNAGKAGAQKRWQNNEIDSTANGDAIENGCDTNGNQEPRTESQEPRVPSEHSGGPVGDLIFSVDPKAFAEYKKHRRELGKPLSGTAEDRLIKRLEKLHVEHGHSPDAMLMQSVDHGWIGVFPLRDDGPQRKSGWRPK